jgi:hypothetical protein
MNYEIMTTNNGYMIFDLDNDDYVYDSVGDNLWDTIDEVNNVLNNLKSKKMKQVIKLTNVNGEAILIGVKSIISVKLIKVTDSSKSIESGLRESLQTKIESIGAMISTNYVKESVEEIYELINQ